MENKAERWAFIEEWLKANFCADCLNQKFHEDFHAKFPEYKRRETYWGSQPCAQAMRDLAEMERCGILQKRRTSLGANWQSGFPKSVVSYTLPEIRRF